MICTKCNTDGVKNQANGKEFYYCRSCKEEITLTVIGNDGADITAGHEIFPDYYDVVDDSDDYEDYYWF